MKINYILRVFALISVVIFLVYSYNKIPKVTYGFASYYTFSRMLLTGENINDSYNPEYFNNKIQEYGINNIYDIQNNFPTNALVYLIVAWTDPVAAKILWGIISIILLATSLLMLLKIFEIKFSENFGLLSVIIVFLWRPFYENIALGQIYILILFLFVISLLGIKKERSSLVSLSLSLNILFKGYGVLIFPWFLTTKKYRVFFICIGILFLLLIILLPVFNLSAWKTYYEVIASSLGRNETDSVVAYQNINGFIRHLFVYHKDINPNALIKINKNIIFLFVLLINLFLVFMILFKSYQNRNNVISQLLSFSAVIAVSVITAPLAEEHHYVLFLPLIIGLGYTLFINNNIIELKPINLLKILFMLALLLIMLPLNYKSMQFSVFPIYLLAYPKLYGGIILLVTYILFVKSVKTKINKE